MSNFISPKDNPLATVEEKKAYAEKEEAFAARLRAMFPTGKRDTSLDSDGVQTEPNNDRDTLSPEAPQKNCENCANTTRNGTCTSKVPCYDESEWTSKKEI